ncbi:DinB family protein [Thermoflavimicrobium dichotomicum]|uniref:Uncharacterized damage-inducible protein DinB (Forms a four-helix bundle) n=1 Tax=Thermoflavimicrobium dichotomicum TaxID=46223 RepID=A0A1I3JMN9_9BACL|nr:DinB family protein [Thermoflavimicrobium dichotomicum]SFI61390.1 Uncharacterized damage-inducible protein DinB (forms a four-helix bundle) [Thermoflavimicrobium dichotomicum]
MSKAENVLKAWLRHRLVLLEVLDLLEDQHLNYKPWENAMTLQQLVTHILFSANMFAKAVKAGKIVPPASSNPPEVQTVSDLKKLAEEITEETKKTITEFSDEKLETPVDMTQLFGTHLPGKSILRIMNEHEIHHKGQLYVYLRLVGVKELPLFVKRQ